MVCALRRRDAGKKCPRPAELLCRRVLRRRAERGRRGERGGARRGAIKLECPRADPKEFLPRCLSPCCGGRVSPVRPPAPHAGRDIHAGTRPGRRDTRRAAEIERSEAGTGPIYRRKPVMLAKSEELIESLRYEEPPEPEEPLLELPPAKKRRFAGRWAEDEEASLKELVKELGDTSKFPIWGDESVLPPNAKL